MDRNAAAARSSSASRPKPIRVYVHLARGFDAEIWRQRHADGSLIGINDPSPYGYARADGQEFAVTFSQDAQETKLGKLLRLGLRAILGFDYLHVRRNAAAILSSDVVWTHTESQFLAIALLLSRQPEGKKPKLLAQSVWLFDRWPKFSALRRGLYRPLIRHASVLTVHSPENLAVAQTLFPDKWIELVLFGIPSETKLPPRAKSFTSGRIKVLCLGNDFDRDWPTAVAALRNQPGIELTILSSRASQSLARGCTNVEIKTVAANDLLRQEFAAADLLLVPLKNNLHASGITVMQEGALHGLPIIASDTGGLRAYFGDDEVTYVPPGDPQALRSAVVTLAGDPARALAQATKAQNRMGDSGLGCNAFIRRHLELSRRLVAAPGSASTKQSSEARVSLIRAEASPGRRSRLS